MRVGPGDPEGAHAGEAGPLAGRPGAGLGRDHQRQLADVDLRVQALEVEVARDFLALEGQRRLDHPGDPGGGLEVAHVGLHRADDQRRLGAAAGAEGGREGVELDRVAERRAGPVGLDVVDRGRGDPGVGERPPDHRLLGGAVRDRQAAAAPVVADRRAADDGDDRVAVAERVREALQHDHPAPLAADQAVGGGVEGLAAAVRRGRAHPRVGDVDRRGQHQVGAAGEGEVALAVAEALAGEVDRDERRRARGVDREVRPLEAEGEGDPAGEDVEGVAGARVQVRGREPARLDQGGVVGEGHPDEDPGVGADEALRRLPRPLERLPHHLEEEALLRVHGGRLAGRDPEEGGVEAGDVDPLEEAAPPGIGLAGGVRVGVVDGVQIPALARHLGDRVAALGEEAPVGLRVVGAAGEAAGEADDRHRLAVGDVAAGGRRRRVLLGRAQDRVEVAGEGLDGRVIEGRRRREAAPERRLEAAPELDRHQRVHAEVEEAAVDLEGALPAEHPRRRGADQVEEPGPTEARREGGELRPEGAPRRGRGRRPGRGSGPRPGGAAPLGTGVAGCRGGVAHPGSGVAHSA
ncbi:MAG: hypothetical protein R3B09_34835, partial [Nannocystaceae bacterium]